MIDEKALIAGKLKRFRENNNLSQHEFAEECGISRNLLSLIETESENLTLDTMQLLSARMGTTLSQLFKYDSITYFVYPSIETVEGFEYNTYGIGVLCDNIMIDCVPDISTDFEKVERLVELCNTEGLALEHLRDVAEDMILNV